jgi:hypothetical protein
VDLTKQSELDTHTTVDLLISTTGLKILVELLVRLFPPLLFTEHLTELPQEPPDLLLFTTLALLLLPLLPLSPSVEPHTHLHWILVLLELVHISIAKLLELDVAHTFSQLGHTGILKLDV